MFTYYLRLGLRSLRRNVVLKVPASADGIELQVSIGAVQDDNLGRTLQLLNSDEFEQPLQLAPAAVGQGSAWSPTPITSSTSAPRPAKQAAT